MQSPFYHYHTVFDAESLIRKYAAPEVLPDPAYHVNYLGLKICPEYLPETMRHLQGTVDPPPIPANWHADIAEWASVLRSVDIAPGPRFAMGELGCGWGCWMGCAGLAAKSSGLEARLYGVEADEQHVSWAYENMAANGFQSHEFSILRAVASAASGAALFPIKPSSRIHYGLEPIMNASSEQIAVARKNNSHELVSMVSLENIFKDEARVDLLHVDIQGGELHLLRGSLHFLNARVSYVVVGTHSRQIEGAIMSIMLEADWILEMERPAIYSLGSTEQLSVDGVQAWRNPRVCESVRNTSDTNSTRM